MDSFETRTTGEGRPAALPQLQDRMFITDSGLETTLIYRHHLDLPEFAAFVLLETNAGRQRLRAYFERHAAIARTHGAGFIAESPTWRANPDWGRTLGYDADRLAAINRAAVMQLAELRARAGQNADTYLISGCIGPRHDGYDANLRMTAPEAERYHDAQIQTFADTAGRPRLRAHHHLRGRGRGDCARRDARRPARRHLLHRGDRRPPALGADHRGRRRSGSTPPRSAGPSTT